MFIVLEAFVLDHRGRPSREGGTMSEQGLYYMAQQMTKQFQGRLLNPPYPTLVQDGSNGYPGHPLGTSVDRINAVHCGKNRQALVFLFVQVLIG